MDPGSFYVLIALEILNVVILMLFSLICSQWVDCALLFFSSSQQLTQAFSPPAVDCTCCTQITGNNEVTIKSSQFYFSMHRLCQQTKKIIGWGGIFSSMLILSSHPSSPASLTLTHNVFVPVFCIHLVPFSLSHSDSSASISAGYTRLLFNSTH